MMDSFTRSMRDCTEIQGESRKVRGVSITFDCTPVAINGVAAGVVISQKAVDEYVPLSRASDGSITTQFVMTPLEELGLLKMDFLGLRTLTVIQDAARMAS